MGTPITQLKSVNRGRRKKTKFQSCKIHSCCTHHTQSVLAIVLYHCSLMALYRDTNLIKYSGMFVFGLIEQGFFIGISAGTLALPSPTSERSGSCNQIHWCCNSSAWKFMDCAAAFADLTTLFLFNSWRNTFI